MGVFPGFRDWVEEKEMDKVYICEECTNEIPFSEEAPQPCQCGAEQSSWVVAEKPERRCGGESK